MKKDNNRSNEKVLIAALMRGSKDAFSSVLEEHRDSVIRICKGFVTSTEDAEDIAQEVFIQLFRSASSIRGESRLSTWLYRVAVNKSINFIRSKKSKHLSDYRSIDTGLRLVSDDESDNSLIRSDHKQALTYALDDLPEKQRTAFVLNKYEELSYEEVADVMQISLSSVQSLIFRAKKKLQESLKDYFEKNIK